MKLLLALALALFSSAALAAPDEEAPGKSRGYPVCPNAKGSFSPEWCLVGVMSHYHSVYPSRAVKKPDTPRPLKRAAQEPALGLDRFLAENRNTGLLVMRGDAILAERYQYERKAEHRFASMSMAKTVIGMLVGIALAERKIVSIDDPAERYVPGVKGHPYGETPIRHLLTMTSGVKFAPYPGYGYQTWVSMKEDRFHLRGLRGQAVWVHPATRTVVVHTGVHRIGGSAAAAAQDNSFDTVLKALGN